MRRGSSRYGRQADTLGLTSLMHHETGKLKGKNGRNAHYELRRGMYYTTRCLIS
jgi:hypothetical protein